MFKKGLLALMLVCVSVGQTPAHADSDNRDTEKAERFVEELGQKIISLITHRELAQSQKENQFRTILIGNFDLPSIGRFVLGRYWRTMSPQEREMYIKLFEDVVVKTYASQFDDYHNETLKVTGAIAGKDGGITVQSKVMRPSNQPLPVDWKIYDIKGQFRVLDIIVNGVSMSISQRSEYAAIIRKNNGQMQGLLDEMRLQASGKQRSAAGE